MLHCVATFTRFCPFMPSLHPYYFCRKILLLLLFSLFLVIFNMQQLVRQLEQLENNNSIGIVVIILCMRCKVITADSDELYPC